MLFNLLKKLARTPKASAHASLAERVNRLQRVQGYGIARTDASTLNPVAHVTGAPLRRQTFWVKQINSGQLTDLGRAALLSAFKGYADPPETQTAQSNYQALMSTAMGMDFAVDPRVQRRYAGDHTLPRGRYYAVCDGSGNDGGTLVGELRAYYTPAAAGLVRIFDCTLPSDRERVRAMEIPVGNPNQLVFGFPPVGRRANPLAQAFAKLGGPSPDEVLTRTEISIGLPLAISSLTRERVLDLRHADAARWFTDTLSSLKWSVPEGEIGCFPDRQPLVNFCELLPELLTQECGGGGATVAAGVLLRWIGADGLIFPSARSDASTALGADDVPGPIGWNYVDFVDAGPPTFFAWIETGKTWPSLVGFRPYADSPVEEEPVWYPEVRISNEEAAWRVAGLRKRTDLRWRKRLLKYVLDCHRERLGERAWGTLASIPELLENQGQIDMAGAIAMFAFDAAMGSEFAAEKLAGLFPRGSGVPDLESSVDQLLTLVHLPVRSELKHQRSIYIPWQASEVGPH